MRFVVYDQYNVMTLIFNQHKQIALRRNLRRIPISCERKLWHKLKNRQLGYKFRRQYGIGKYIVDFYCPKLELIIELDGATHATDEEIKKDEMRQKYLEDLGLIVKRYCNVDIINNFSEVIGNIQEVCEQLSKTSPPACAGRPTLSLRRRGRKKYE